MCGSVIYFNAISHPFVHDDVVFILNNPDIAHWDNFSQIFFNSSASAQAAPGINAYYRPVLELLYRLQYQVFHYNPGGYHLFNVIVHILNSILVYNAVLLLSSRKMFSLAVSVLFLVHPVQSEAVSCISGVSSLIFTLFLLASFRFYVHSAQYSKNAFGYAVSLAFYFLALFAKEQAVIFAGLIVLYEFCFREKIAGTFALKALRCFGFFVVTLGFLSVRMAVTGSATPAFWVYKEELFLRILALPQILVMYLTTLIIPGGLHYYRAVDILQPFIVPGVILAVIILAVVLFIRSSARDTQRVMLFGLGWFVIALVPLFILPLIIEYSFIMAAEHFLYFPVIGFFVLALCMIQKSLKVIFKDSCFKMAALIFIVSVFIFGALTVRQNTFWRGEVPLFARALQFQPQLGRVHILLAKAYYVREDYDSAIQEFKEAERILSGYLEKTGASPAENFYLGLLKGIYFDMAHCYEAKGQWAQAAAQYGQAVKIDLSDGMLHNNLGAALLHLNDFSHAKKHFERALAIDPHNLMAMGNLAVCYIEEGNLDEAERLFRAALAIDPGFVSAKQNLQVLLLDKANR